MSVEKKNTESTGKHRITRVSALLGATSLVVILSLLAFRYFDRQSDASQSTASGQPSLPPVVVHSVEKADLALTKDYIGRVEAMQTVDVKPQVAGEIARVHFPEGGIVKEGDILFTLDSKQYQAAVDLRCADLAKAEANLKWAVQYHNRLKASDKRSVSASDLEAAESGVSQGEAAVAQARASLRSAQIDLGYTRIKAPIGGRIGKAQFTRGNYVTPAGAPLATLVQIDPVRIAFAVPDRDYLDSVDAFTANKDDVYTTTITLPNGTPYPYDGKRDFEDNVMNTATGTIEMRLRVKNDKNVLVPGTMVRVHTRPVKNHIALVVPQEGIMADAEGDFVYTVNEESFVERRRIETGKEVGQMTEIRSGLADGDRVVIRGLQSVRPETRVRVLSLNAGGKSLSPAEQAMESGYDLGRSAPGMR